MSEWKEYKLKDLTTKIGSGSTPRGGSNNYKDVGIPLIRSQNVLDFSFTTTGLAFIDDYQAEELKGVMVKENDILFNITGDSVARCCIVPKQFLPARVNQHVAIIRTNNLADYKFIFYYLQFLKPDLLIKAEIGATRNAITKVMLEDIDILLPPLLIQTAIASILSSLDDKIDLLRRQNATLEKMAETLFRQWFVEEAKEEWKMGKIFDYALHFKDSIHPQKNKTILYYHYSIPAFDNEKNPICELGKEIQSNKYKVPANCILFSKLNPHKDKRIWLLQNEVDPHAICSTEFQVILPRRKEHLYFLYGWLSLRDNYNEIASGVGGTSGSHQRINPNTIYDFQCPLATESVIKNFNTKTEPLFQKQLVNQAQIRTLTALRDTLLPQLMSGEVQVKV